MHSDAWLIYIYKSGLYLAVDGTNIYLKRNTIA